MYLARQPVAWWQYLPDDPVAPAQVVVTPPEPVNTGLVDHHGTPIWRMPEQIGFLPTRKISR